MKHQLEKDHEAMLAEFWEKHEDFNQNADCEVTIGHYNIKVEYDEGCDSDFMYELEDGDVGLVFPRGQQEYGKRNLIASIDEVIKSEYFAGPQTWNVTKFKNQYWFLPVYRYSHSGVAYSTEPFSCPWDSGLAGLVYISKADLLARGMPEIKKRTSAFEKSLIAHYLLRKVVKNFDDHVNGRYYNISVSKLGEQEPDFEDYGYLGESGLVCGLQSAIQYVNTQNKSLGELS